MRLVRWNLNCRRRTPLLGNESESSFLYKVGYYVSLDELSPMRLDKIPRSLISFLTVTFVCLITGCKKDDFPFSGKHTMDIYKKTVRMSVPVQDTLYRDVIEIVDAADELRLEYKEDNLKVVLEFDSLNKNTSRHYYSGRGERQYCDVIFDFNTDSFFVDFTYNVSQAGVTYYTMKGK